MNSAGASPYSMFASCVTPAAPPSTVTSVKVHPKSTSLTISWKEPANNGSPLTGYYIDIGEKELTFASPDLTEFTIDEVLPDTAYRYASLRSSRIFRFKVFGLEFVCERRTLSDMVLTLPQWNARQKVCRPMFLSWNVLWQRVIQWNWNGIQSTIRMHRSIKQVNRVPQEWSRTSLKWKEKTECT